MRNLVVVFHLIGADKSVVLNIFMGPAAPTQEQKTRWIIKDDLSANRTSNYLVEDFGWFLLLKRVCV